MRGMRGPCSPDAVVLAPSLLAADPLRLADSVASLKGTRIDRLHIDVMDGTFVPNFTFGVDMVARLAATTNLPLEVHLMIERPELHIERFARAGAWGLIVHAETSPHLHRTLQSIHENGCAAGVALNPSTSEVMILPVLSRMDLALVMTVNPGFGGQAFLPEVLPKLTRLAKAADDAGLTLELEVDGGITPDTARQAHQAGATALVAGTSVFDDPDGPAAGVDALRRALLPA